MYTVNEPSFLAAAINASRSNASFAAALDEELAALLEAFEAALDAALETALLELELDAGALVAAGATVGGTAVGGIAVGGTAVGGTAVGATVGAGAAVQAATAIKSIVRTTNTIVRRMIGSPLKMVRSAFCPLLGDLAKVRRASGNPPIVSHTE